MLSGASAGYTFPAWRLFTPRNSGDNMREGSFAFPVDLLYGDVGTENTVEENKKNKEPQQRPLALFRYSFGFETPGR